MAEQHSQTSDYQNRWKFTGHELDRETGLYYAGARYYDPRVSIWLSVDPLVEQAPGWTPYRYGFQNPISYTDPTGMFEEGDPGQKGWLGRQWNKIKGWFRSDNNQYQDIPKGLIEVGQIEVINVESSNNQNICTIGCHNTQVGNLNEDVAGQFRDLMKSLGLASTVLDSGSEILNKSSVFGIYSGPLTISTGFASIFSDYHSESNFSEFTSNSVQTGIEVRTALKSPTLALALNINFQDAQTSDGLTNLQNGRLANTFSSSFNSNQAYLTNNFYNQTPSPEYYKSKVDPASGRNKFDMFIIYSITFRWNKAKRLMD